MTRTNTLTMEELTENEREKVNLNNEVDRTMPAVDADCHSCGEELVSRRICLNCGQLQQPPTDTSDDTSKSPEEAKRKSKADTGRMLQTVGALLSLTIVGAIIGVPVVIIGMKLEADAKRETD